jgi:hypothetical protein
MSSSRGAGHATTRRMASLHSDSRDTLRPIPMLRLEDASDDTPTAKGEYESLRPVAGPEVSETEGFDRRPQKPLPRPGRLSHTALLSWTVGSLLFGSLVLARGAVALLKPAPEPPAVVAPLPVAAAAPPIAPHTPPEATPSAVPAKATPARPHVPKSGKSRAAAPSHATRKTATAVSKKTASPGTTAP